MARAINLAPGRFHFLDEGLVSGMFFIASDNSYAAIVDPEDESDIRHLVSNRYDLAISYAVEDIGLARDIARRLTEQEFRVYLIDVENAPETGLWWLKYKLALFQSRYVLPILSQTYGIRRASRDEAEELLQFASAIADDTHWFPILPILKGKRACLQDGVSFYLDNIPYWHIGDGMDLVSDAVCLDIANILRLTMPSGFAGKDVIQFEKSFKQVVLGDGSVRFANMTRSLLEALAGDQEQHEDNYLHLEARETVLEADRLAETSLWHSAAVLYAHLHDGDEHQLLHRISSCLQALGRHTEAVVLLRDEILSQYDRNSQSFKDTYGYIFEPATGNVDFNVVADRYLPQMGGWGTKNFREVLAHKLKTAAPYLAQAGDLSVDEILNHWRTMRNLYKVRSTVNKASIGSSTNIDVQPKLQSEQMSTQQKRLLEKEFRIADLFENTSVLKSDANSLKWDAMVALRNGDKQYAFDTIYAFLDLDPEEEEGRVIMKQCMQEIA